jgi:hypothetical protein
MADRLPFRRKSGNPISRHGGPPEQPYAFMHPCYVEGCEASAPFGFGVSLLRGRPGRWACEDHKAGLSGGALGNGEPERAAPMDEEQLDAIESGDIGVPETTDLFADKPS